MADYRRVNGAAVLVVGVEPTRALARRIAIRCVYQFRHTSTPSAANHDKREGGTFGFDPLPSRVGNLGRLDPMTIIEIVPSVPNARSAAGAEAC